MSLSPTIYSNPCVCADDILKNVGREIVMKLPVGVGKPTHIVNEFYRRAKADSKIKLTICTGLTLHTPIPNSELERRFLEPLVKRLFPGYPDPVYFEDAKNRKMPPNVELKEIYFSPGYALGNTRLQRNYISANYTYVPRATAATGCNVVAVMLAKRDGGAHPSYSLGSNVDASIMMIRALGEEIKAGGKAAVLGQVNSYMPYMTDTAELSGGDLTGVLDSPDLNHRLFSPPKEPVSSTEYSIAFHVCSLIKDGGTFQVGFGSLGDAIIYCLQLRHKDSGMFRRVINETKIYGKFGNIIEAEGGTGTFDKGLYGCSEFIFDGFLTMIDDGIIKRKVYDHPAIQKLYGEEKISETVSANIMDVLLEEEAVSEKITEKEFRFLRKFGIFKETLEYEKGAIRTEGGKTIPADLSDPASRAAIAAECLGGRLKNEVLVHAGFFVGSQSFYDTLIDMDDARLRRIQMREISFVNDLIRDTELKMMQRKHGRFANTALMASLLGGVASDTLDSGQVVSGVGGQYNFISMAHQLPGARSILMIRSVRESDGETGSNLVWTCGNLTIPRHMRDIFVTEYGIADVRDRTDGDTIAAMLNITDSRFQNGLLRKAKENHKLSKNYEIPPAFRNNYPEAVEALAAPFKKKGLFPVFPYGTEFTKEELILAKALRGLKKKMSLKGFRPPSPGDTGKILFPPAAAKPFLERMQLDKPSSVEETVMRKLVLFALSSCGAI